MTVTSSFQILLSNCPLFLKGFFFFFAVKGIYIFTSENGLFREKRKIKRSRLEVVDGKERSGWWVGIRKCGQSSHKFVLGSSGQICRCPPSLHGPLRDKPSPVSLLPIPSPSSISISLFSVNHFISFFFFKKKIATTKKIFFVFLIVQLYRITFLTI